MWNAYILQNILVLGAFMSRRTIGKTSSNVETFCNANCRCIHQVALQITRYPGYNGTPVYRVLHHMSKCWYLNVLMKNEKTSIIGTGGWRSNDASSLVYYFKGDIALWNNQICILQEKNLNILVEKWIKMKLYREKGEICKFSSFSSNEKKTK